MEPMDFSKLELLILDVDGVLTDGKITLTPDGEEIKSFHVRDGSGMRYWKRVGKKLAIITGRGSRAVEVRARELDIDTVRLNAKNKLPAYREVLAELGVLPEQTAVMGDDLTDLPMLRNCALAAAPADAVDEVREVANLVTQRTGGNGAVRELVERILKGSGLWQQVMARYVAAPGEPTR